MKKTYIEPSVKAVEIKTTAILAGSEIESGGDTNQNLSLDLDFEEEQEEY